MKAVVLEQQGSLEALRYVPDFPDPVVKQGHVVIRVKAASFNYHDVFTVRGMPGIKVP
jgi:NADPH:quinone reductase-like Zn-dependent oxidoreductase